MMRAGCLCLPLRGLARRMSDAHAIRRCGFLDGLKLLVGTRGVGRALAVRRVRLGDGLPLSARARGERRALAVRLPGHIRRRDPTRGGSGLILVGKIARAQRRAYARVVRASFGGGPFGVSTDGMVCALAIRRRR